jgi:hypothetical protein
MSLLTTDQRDEQIVATLEHRIRWLLADPAFCPNSEQLERYRRMKISAELKADLTARWDENWLGLDELEGRE